MGEGTPNIDRLANEGVRLSQHLAAASMCTPSRAAFLTGRYPIRSGTASPSNLNRDFAWLGGSGGLPINETTFAKLLQHRGYRTGLIGKWHLGLNCASRDDHCYHPLNHGFDYFYGMPLGLLSDCQAAQTPELHRSLRVKLWISTAVLGLLPLLLMVPRFARWFSVPWKVIFILALIVFLFFMAWYSSYGFVRRWNCILMRNHEIVQQPIKEEKVSSLMLKEALAFMERYKREPFLLWFSLLHVHTPLITREKFVRHSKYGLYGDNVEEMDWMVGKILDALDQNHATNRTLVYFTSDNGAWLESWAGVAQAGGWNGVYKAKTELFVSPEKAENRVIDGRNLMPLLEGRVSHSDHEFLFHYCGIHLHTVRWHQKDCATVWKAHYVTPKFSPEGSGACYGQGMCSCSGEVTYHDPPLLFDIARDPSEALPLSPDNEVLFDSVIKKIEVAIKDHRRTLTPVPQQLSAFSTIWKPWLQPCCGTFPFCGCDKELDIVPTAL
ncbi:arylsulfatase H [Otolemur garnettii]|uniref:arylsulfatase H n=1 Tax=Otolemur garnettii TaxID=30611 RepID=UPI0006442327|nr:arylsulfatase H [Otolemur garnettii]